MVKCSCTHSSLFYDGEMLLYACKIVYDGEMLLYTCKLVL